MISMNSASWPIFIALILVPAKWGAQLWLARLNERNVLAHAGAVPEAFKEAMDEATYAKSVQYTLARSRFGQIEMSFDMPILLLVLFSGVLPWGFRLITARFGASAW